MLVKTSFFLGLALSARSLQWDRAQYPEKLLPLENLDHVPSKPAAYNTFVDHFSANRYSTEIALQTHFTSLNPNSSVVVTNEYTFDLLRYARMSGEDIVVREIEDIGSIKRVQFARAYRRRDGQGGITEAVAFAGYEVAWGNQEFTAVVAMWLEGFNYMTQWHLISSASSLDPSPAHSLIQACSAWCTTLREAILVFDQSWWRADHALWLSVQQASWEDVILDDELKGAVTRDYRSFFRSEEVYKNLHVPWKRGLIFLGPPGNGKTISVKAIMKEVKVPVLYVKSFHTYAGDEFGIRQIFTRARAEAPCVLVLEDLDSLITDMNRSFFLNEVDGLEDNDGLLLIGTTNHFERLDPALSNRPSRFDRKYNFPNPSKSERRLYAVYWQDKLHVNKEVEFPDALLDEFAAETDKFSFAYMKEAFVSTLLTLAGQDSASKDSNFGTILIQQVKKLRSEIDSGDEVQATSWLRNPSDESGTGRRNGQAHAEMWGGSMPANGMFQEEAQTMDYMRSEEGEEMQRVMMPREVCFPMGEVVG